MSDHVLTLKRLLGRLNVAENLSWPERYAIDAAIAALSNAAHGSASHGIEQSSKATFVPCDCGCGRSCCAHCGVDVGFVSENAAQGVGEPKRGEATGDTTTFSDAWARLSQIDRAVITAYFERHFSPAVARNEGEVEIIDKPIERVSWRFERITKELVRAPVSEGSIKDAVFAALTAQYRTLHHWRADFRAVTEGNNPPESYVLRSVVPVDHTPRGAGDVASSGPGGGG